MGSRIAMVQHSHNSEESNHSSSAKTKENTEQVFVFNRTNRAEYGKNRNKSKNNC